MISKDYKPCAYLLEGVEPAALYEDGPSFQHYLALGVNRLMSVTEVASIEWWISRCLSLRLRPVLLLSSYDSALAQQYRTYCRRFDSQQVQWIVWPPEPEEMTHILRDPDAEVIEALFNGRPEARADANGSMLKSWRAIWHEPLLHRLAGWLQDFGDRLPEGVALGDLSIETLSKVLAIRSGRSPRVVVEWHEKMGLAASSGQKDEPIKLPVGSWTIAREEIPDDPENQFLIFRCNKEVIEDFAGRKVEVDIGGRTFELGTIDDRGAAEVLIPRGLDFKLAIDIRIIDGDG